MKDLLNLIRPKLTASVIEPQQDRPVPAAQLQ